MGREEGSMRAFIVGVVSREGMKAVGRRNDKRALYVILSVEHCSTMSIINVA